MQFIILIIYLFGLRRYKAGACASSEQQIQDIRLQIDVFEPDVHLFELLDSEVHSRLTLALDADQHLGLLFVQLPLILDARDNIFVVDALLEQFAQNPVLVR